MPPRSHTAAARNARTSTSHEPRARPRQVAQRLPISKFGWDRKFRIVMLVVVAMVGWVGLKAGLALVSARAQAAQEASLVSSLLKQHSQLVAQQKALHQKSTIMRDARQLGMVSAGERPFVVVTRSH
ncbi:MAG: septum formation initiator family protein [Acidobacteriota bacterium]|nr:septum formation initiator family protein [Acidobacteriota bacterium]